MKIDDASIETGHLGGIKSRTAQKEETMKVDARLTGPLPGIPELVAKFEDQGFDRALSAETSNDPFLPILLAAEHSRRIELGTSIAVAFARNPMTVAMMAHDLNVYSQGRFVLGLGSQIRPHITKRFSMPWSQPAARMREFIQALGAIWESWHEGKPLNFRGDFYTHTLMTPMFTPRDTRFGAPRVTLAAVGPLMTEVAGEVAQGLVAHAFTTERYLRDVTLPAVERGLEKGGRKRSDFELCCPVFVVSGRTEEEHRSLRSSVCQQISFYGSTPAYRPVLEAHGWGELQGELNALSKQGRWVDMGGLIDDEILSAFAVVGEPQEVAAGIRSRFQGLADRVSIGLDFVDESQRGELIRRIQEG